MEPNEIVTHAQQWLTAIITLAVGMAGAAIALGKLYADTKKKLHTVIQGVEDAEIDPAHKDHIKKAIMKKEVEKGVNLDQDIARATGRLPRHLRDLVIFLSMFLAVGCSSVRLDKQYVEADRKTFNAIASAYLRYVEQDENLNDDQKELRRDLIASWDGRLREEEKGNDQRNSKSIKRDLREFETRTWFELESFGSRSNAENSELHQDGSTSWYRRIYGQRRQ